MAAPMVTFIYKDADGDEFPVRVPDSGLAHRAAQREAERLVASGDWRPNGELRYDRSEREER